MIHPVPVTSLGSLPGTDFPAALRLMLADQPELACLPELPARGLGSDLIGRALALTAGLGFDLQPAGWRLTSRPSADHRRAQAQWRRDLDDWEEQATDFSGTMKLSVAGPWTLAAAVERPRGDRLLADHGARVELAASLGEGIGSLIGELRSRRPAISWQVQLDEPSLPAVLAGQIRTASGFSRHRRVDQTIAAAALTAVLAPAADQLAGTVLHCCAPGLDLDVVSRAGIETVALDLSLITGPGRSGAELDQVAGWLDAGRRLWWGVLPAEQLDVIPRPDQLADRVSAAAGSWGFALADLAGNLTLTPSCGLAGWTPRAVSAGLASLRTAAELLAERVHG